MGYVGGDVKLIEINHEVLGSKKIFPKAGEEATLNRGGVVTADDAANRTAAGQLMSIKSEENGSFEVLCANDNVDNREAKFCRQLMASSILSDVVITYISGAVIGGKAEPVGTIAESSNATFTLKLAFDGEINDL